MYYVRLCKKLQDKGLLIPETANPADYIDDDSKDYYLSIFKYTEEQNTIYQKQGGSVAGIRDVVTDKIYWDFDKESNLEHSQNDAVELCKRLVGRGIKKENIFVAFSGNKGFDVTVVTNYLFGPRAVKNMATNLAKDLETFDTTMYDAPQIFRIPGTKHQKTGLYKTQLSVDELMSLTPDQIREKAKVKVSTRKISEVEIPDDIVSLAEVDTRPQVTVDENSPLSPADFSSKPKWMHESKWLLQQGYYEKGEGNEARMILAATYKAQGFDRDMAAQMIYLAERRRGERLEVEPSSYAEIQRQILNTVYGPFWTGGQYGVETNELLQKICARFDLHVQKADDITTVKIGDVRERFIDFAVNVDKNRILSGIKTLDDNVMLLTGMMVGIIGAPSSGKTSFSNIINLNQGLNANQVYFGSYDMYDSLLYARYLQQFCGYDLKHILESIRDNRIDAKLKSAFEEVEKHYSHVGFNFKSGPTVDEIERDLVEYEQSTGVKVKLMVVDYLEKISGPYSDATANSGFVAGRLSDIARKHDLCLIVLLQPQKMAGDPSDELNSMRNAKGASRIEQDCRVMLTVSRPGFNIKDSSNDNFITINCVKNNMGTVGSFDLAWDGRNGRIREMTEEERAELKCLREQIALEEEATSSGGFGSDRPAFDRTSFGSSTIQKKINPFNRV